MPKLVGDAPGAPEKSVLSQADAAVPETSSIG
jgi:hypothetical protein